MSWIEWTDSLFRGLDLSELKVDQAYLNISNSNDEHYYLYTLSDECVACPFKRVKRVAEHNETIVKLGTTHGLDIRLFTKDKGPYVHSDVVTKDVFFSMKEHLGEFGVYDLIIKNSGATTFVTAKEPVSTFACE
jgi:hypothetical protein